ncbi:HAMP domain-containing histidine kinase [Tenacibaculum finnmarkense genomovar finnmarkense]|uniref:histidine kinase n=1 Tax=Tenacibaculum finnmarkense genomovar finnmarkense TaxID=1458503 RepID=A0AAP1RE71_9FLAO|nr:HAMP domain-containing sensor histidine kinase [Tenacibaculum finnmarkense]ALU75587.1 histidine kinase [Tenacibaculum dicentrarchi]MBE7633006.1 sensor histidine kinase [Tenacibaculum finnmarkense genomovar ulcerans]MBE7651871.1 sensor histidine kinase [Tenacibaculum finnmarkense genomovar finnmarkense]MBE7691612.1 sensor histidine kinase [Tenacibaculum finnmarkense genomovar finnmarkense]MBE7694414.1 sensor histidine kinase [Tenacibaculum finnmarkense genomovar finnmarkense]
MIFFKNTYWAKRISVFISLLIVSFILWNTYVFFQKFKEEERGKIEIFAAAFKELAANIDLNENTNLINKIYQTIEDIPTILVNENGGIDLYRNLDTLKSKNPKYLEAQLAIMKRQNAPIMIEYFGITQYLYYRNSDLLCQLKYYPLALLLILGLFLTIVYMMYTSNKIADQNKLWTGMAKETAHQIGTPLSSLLGWIAILRSEDVNEDYILEIEKDVDRLNTIANRFSKIGSLPKLKIHNIVLETQTAFNYLKSRSSKKVHFSFSSDKKNISTLLNIELYGWVIENLLKNAIDAMQGKGDLSLAITETPKQVKISITDSGKGLQKKLFKQIFEPGFTTKKRGWGLGLSLSKRIVEEYHNGKIVVQKSTINKGTTFEISLDKI